MYSKIKLQYKTTHIEVLDVLLVFRRDKTVKKTRRSLRGRIIYLCLKNPLWGYEEFFSSVNFEF